jgi:hypothetical protein
MSGLTDQLFVLGQLTVDQKRVFPLKRLHGASSWIEKKSALRAAGKFGLCPAEWPVKQDCRVACHKAKTF